MRWICIVNVMIRNKWISTPAWALQEITFVPSWQTLFGRFWYACVSTYFLTYVSSWNHVPRWTSHLVSSTFFAKKTCFLLIYLMWGLVWQPAHEDPFPLDDLQKKISRWMGASKNSPVSLLAAKPWNVSWRLPCHVCLMTWQGKP